MPIMACSKAEEKEVSYVDYSTYTEVATDNPVLLDSVKNLCQTSPLYGSSVGLFGGSLSANPESYAAKLLWQKCLGLKITTYGVPGHGFSSLQGSIQKQVASAGKHDIYILWCSTNDYTTDREIGTPDDYTQFDGFDPTRLTTQCGGINYCIRQLRRLNPDALICIFGSLKFFSTADGYTIASGKTNNLGYEYYDYITAQQQVADRQGIPYFSQWDIPVCTPSNASRYHLPDRTHLSAEGYANIAIYQLLFLSSITR